MPSDLLFLQGCKNFRTTIEKNDYYVDMTSYLKDLFMSSYEVMNPLFIRPRRFGKTLNMDMIKEFCELNRFNYKLISYSITAVENFTSLFCNENKDEIKVKAFSSSIVAFSMTQALSKIFFISSERIEMP
jgi:hypothetical protein